MKKRFPVVTFFLVVLLIFVLPLSAQAVITYVGTAEGSGTNSSFNVSLTGLSLQAGDLVIVGAGSVAGTDTNFNPGVGTSGYTEVADLFSNDTRDANFSVSWKIMGATPDTTVACNGSEIANNASLCVIHVWRGVDSSSPMDVTVTTATGISSSIPDGPSITPVTSGAVVIAAGFGTASAVDNAVTAPSGYSNQADISSDPGSAAIMGIASKAWTSGAEDPAVWTNWSTNLNEAWAAVTLALRPIVDTTAPTPNPSTFSSAPAAAGATSITMTASTATDAAGSTPVQYYFTYTACGSNPGTGAADSGWQTSATYTDSGLAVNKCYGYTTKSEDSLANVTTASSVTSVYTLANAPGTPTLSNQSSYAAIITNAENSNPSNTLFAIQVSATSPTDSTWNGKYVDASGDPSATAVWLSDSTWDGLVISGLTPGTQYTIQSKAKNGDAAETAFSSTNSITTLESAVKTLLLFGNILLFGVKLF